MTRPVNIVPACPVLKPQGVMPVFSRAGLAEMLWGGERHLKRCWNPLHLEMEGGRDTRAIGRSQSTVRTTF